MAEAVSNGNHIPNVYDHNVPMSKNEFLNYAEAFGLGAQEAESIFNAADDNSDNRLNGGEVKSAHDDLFSEDGGDIKLSNEFAEFIGSDADGKIDPAIIKEMMERGYLAQDSESGEWGLSDTGENFKYFARATPGGLEGADFNDHLANADEKGFDGSKVDINDFMTGDADGMVRQEMQQYLYDHGYIDVIDDQVELSDKGQAVYAHAEANGGFENGQLYDHLLAFETSDSIDEFDIQELGAALGTEDSPRFTSADDNAKRLILENYDGLPSTSGAVQNQIDEGFFTVNEDGKLVATQKGIDYAEFLNENEIVGTSTPDGYASMLMKDSGADYDAGKAQQMMDDGLLAVGSGNYSAGNNVVILTEKGYEELIELGYLDNNGDVTQKGLDILGLEPEDLVES